MKCVDNHTKLKVQQPEVRPQVPQAQEWESLLRNKEYYEGLKTDFSDSLFRGQK